MKKDEKAASMFLGRSSKVSVGVCLHVGMGQLNEGKEACFESSYSARSYSLRDSPIECLKNNDLFCDVIYYFYYSSLLVIISSIC